MKLSIYSNPDVKYAYVMCFVYQSDTDESNAEGCENKTDETKTDRYEDNSNNTDVQMIIIRPVFTTPCISLPAHSTDIDIIYDELSCQRRNKQRSRL